MSHKHSPIDDLERFELMQMLFPEELPDDDDESWDKVDDLIYEKFGVDPEQFDLIVGHLVMLAPVMESGLTKRRMHVLGKVTVEGDNQYMCAGVKREVQS